MAVVVGSHVVRELPFFHVVAVLVSAVVIHGAVVVVTECFLV